MEEQEEEEEQQLDPEVSMFQDEGVQVIEDGVGGRAGGAQIDSSSKSKTTTIKKRPTQNICTCYPNKPTQDPDFGMTHRKTC